MSHADRIAHERSLNDTSLSTVEKLRKDIVGAAGTLFSQAPEIRGLSYRDGIYDISENARRFQETLESPNFLRGFWIASSEIVSHLSTVLESVERHHKLFTPQFREEISDIRSRVDSLVRQYDMAVATSLIPALTQIDQKEGHPVSNRKISKAERMRQNYLPPVDKAAFETTRTLHVEPLFQTLSELQETFDTLARRTHNDKDPASRELTQRISHDRALADHLGTTTEAIHRVLRNADQLIQNHFAREQAAPAR